MARWHSGRRNIDELNAWQKADEFSLLLHDMCRELHVGHDKEWLIYLLQQAGQRSAFDQFQGQEWPVVVLADLIDLDEIGVPQPGNGLGFGLKALHLSATGQLAGQNHFERHGPIQAHLARAEYHPHAAARDLPLQFIVSEVMN